MATKKKSISRKAVKQAALDTADPAKIFTAALAAFPSNPAALYEDNVINALKAIRQKSEAAYTRLIVKAKGCKTTLDKLTAPDRDDDGHAQDNIVNLVKDRSQLGHDPDGQGLAIINGKPRQVYYINGSGFQAWLRALVYEQTKSGISDTTLTTILATLSAIGMHDGSEIQVHVRCARHGDAYYIDLCNDQWSAIRIDAKGWEIVEAPPVYFTRSKNMRPLPEPKPKGDLGKLWKHINIPEIRRLPLLTWLLDAYRPDTPFPVLETTGEHGSAKSTAQRRLRDLIDPNKVPLRGRPKSVEDIYVGAANSWIVSFENVSNLTPEQQDAICTLATGGGIGTRHLYTNGDEFVLETKRPVMINGINAVATQPDLIDRVINIETPAISPDQRQDERALEAAWPADYPYILGGVLDLFSNALRLLPKVHLKEKYRMADYQMLGEAVARAQGHPPGHFSKIYAATVNEGIDRSLETYGVVNALQVFMASCAKPWEGTVMALMAHLNALPGVDRSNWPKSPRGLSGQLKRVAPGLRRHGVLVERLEHTRIGTRIRITVLGDEAKPKK